MIPRSPIASGNNIRTRTFPDDLVATILACRGRVPDARWDEFHFMLNEWADADLDHGRGVFVASGLEDLDEDGARTFTLTASATLGRVMPQSFGAEMVREVKDRGQNIEQDRTTRYSDTRFGGNMHTDGMHREGHVPDYFTLYCVRPALQGGELLLVDVADLLDQLTGRPDILSTLRSDFFFDTRASDPALPRAIRRPILENYGRRIRVHYFREYIESGQEKVGTSPLTSAQREALDFVDSVVTESALQQSVRAGAGEMLFINNTRLLHGRTDFADGPERGRGRLLFRTWIDASAREPLDSTQIGCSA